MNVHTSAAASTAIRTLDAAEAKTRLDELADILVDAVAHGASVNFMASFLTQRRSPSGATSCRASPRMRSGCSSATMDGGWWRRPC